MSGVAAWRVASRPHTLPASVAPVLVGGGLAQADGVFRWDVFMATAVAAVAIQVAANFANDVSDARRGADSPDRVGPPRMVSQGVISSTAMWAGVWVALAVAGAAAVWLTAIAGPVVLVIGAVSVLAMLGYVGGPIPYGYRGLGEVFVFVFFGLVATVGSRFVYDGTAPRSAWLLAVPVGLLAAAILVANNYRDMATDADSGKRTLAVIMGPRRTKWLFAVLVFAPYLSIAAFAMSGLTPRSTLFAALLAPLGLGPVRLLADDRNLVAALKLTARLHLVTGAVLAMALALSG